MFSYVCSQGWKVNGNNLGFPLIDNSKCLTLQAVTVETVCISALSTTQDTLPMQA